MTDTLSRLRSLDECATACGVNLRTLLKLIDDGKGPAILRIGRQIRIREADFTAWLDQVAAKETAVRARTAVC